MQDEKTAMIQGWFDRHGINTEVKHAEGSLVAEIGGFKIWFRPPIDERQEDFKVWSMIITRSSAPRSTEDQPLDSFDDLFWCMQQEPKELRKIQPRLEQLVKETANLRQEMVGMEIIEHERNAYKKLALEAMKS